MTEKGHIHELRWNTALASIGRTSAICADPDCGYTLEGPDLLATAGEADWQRAKRLECMEMLKACRDAIGSLQIDALGQGSETVTLPDGECGLMTWSIRDELIDKINKALD